MDFGWIGWGGLDCGDGQETARERDLGEGKLLASTWSVCRFLGETVGQPDPNTPTLLRPGDDRLSAVLGKRMRSLVPSNGFYLSLMT